MCIFAFCVHGCVLFFFSPTCVFVCLMSWRRLLYILERGLFVRTSCLSSSCTVNKAGTPLLALGGILQRIWALGPLPRMTNECPLFWWRVIPLVDLLVCASVCCVSSVTQFSLPANKEASLVFVLLVLLLALLCMSIVRRCGSQ